MGDYIESCQGDEKSLLKGAWFCSRDHFCMHNCGLRKQEALLLQRDFAMHLSNPATTKHLSWKLEFQTCRVALYAWFYVYPFWYNTEMWQTHTNRRTDTRGRHIPHLA